MNNNSDSTGRTEEASKSLSAKVNSSPVKKLSSVSEPRPPHFHSQTKNSGCHPEIIVSTDAPMPIHFFAEGEPKNSASNLACQPEIITAEAPVHPHYMDLDEDGRQNRNNDERRDSSSTRSKKHFNIVLPSSTTRPIVSPDSNPPAESTTDIPFYAVEATAIIPETVYEADIVVDDEHTDIQVTQNQLCPRTRKHQLIIVAILVLVLCIMSAVIGALTASKSSNEDHHIAITNTSATASIVTTSRPPPTLSTTEPPKTTTTEATQTINLEGYRLAVNVNYAISSTCNVNATDVLNKNGNTIKRGLIEATEKWTIRILNETFPRAGSTRGGDAWSIIHPCTQFLSQCSRH